jgi:uncharacterized protein (DUF2236 family)
MRWVTAPVFDSAQALYEAFVRRLSGDEREQLYQETITWGELFGMPRDALPATYPAFREWWPRALTADGMFLTDEARQVGLNIGLRMPAPTPLQPAMRIVGFLIVGTLPPTVREAYSLRWTRADQLAFEATALALRRSRPLVPSRVRRGSSTEAYQLIARTERHNRRKGTPSFQSIG